MAAEQKSKPQLLRGFRDFYPEDWAFQTWFYQKAKKISESFGFQEYEGPTVETLDLYAAKSGEELVKKQAFTLKDQSGKVLALRPEMTPTLARMIAQKSGEIVFPAKWYTYGRRFRYEKPQKGRGREFFQWDIDMLGPENLEADAEIILIAAKFYQELGLSPNEVRIKVNDRQFVQQNLEEIGIPENQTVSIFKVIDKKEKVSEKDFDDMLTEKGLSDKQVSAVRKYLSDKRSFQKSAWLSRIFSLISQTDLVDYVEYEPSIVRGLDYYTRTVFEGWDIKGEFRSIWGGGRYDNLTAEVGGKTKIPGVGFAMGDMVIAEVLKANGKFPDLSPTTSRILVTLFSPELLTISLQIANSLRQSGINTELYPDPATRLDSQLKYANAKGIPFVIIIGPDEVAAGKVTVKNMETGEQTSLNNTNLNELKRIINE